MIRVLIAHFSVKIYLYTYFLLSGKLSMSFEPALRPDPPIWTWLGKKMPSSGHLDKFLKLEGSPGPIWTNWAQRRLDKNPIFRIRPFLLLPGILSWLPPKGARAEYPVDPTTLVSTLPSASSPSPSLTNVPIMGWCHQSYCISGSRFSVFLSTTTFKTLLLTSGKVRKMLVPSSLVCHPY